MYKEDVRIYNKKKHTRGYSLQNTWPNMSPALSSGQSFDAREILR